MAAARTTRHARPRPQPVRFLVGIVVVVAILYFAKIVLVPLAFASLLTLVLTPLVVTIQRRVRNRVAAVLIVVTLTGAVIAVVAWQVGTQVNYLIQDLPAHAQQMKEKVSKLGASTGRFSRFMKSFEGLGDAFDKPTTAPGAPAEAATQPVVTTEATSSLSRLEYLAGLLLEPLASALVVAVLVIFMLIRREDLRNRIIGLLGHGRLTGTTRVLVEAATRISRLLLLQLGVNTAFGTIFGAALFFIGVPYWFLWGFLTVFLRFVPYVGSWLAAALPVFLMAATAPGWGSPLLVLAVFIVLDLTTSNAVEPLLFGHSTGVSPVALLVAALFWTWLWGPIGLILSTPMTVCLVVLGQHVAGLRFLWLLLGDQPALAPHLSYYQRLVAGDRDEARQLVKVYAEKKGVENVPDDLLIPALRLARRDRLHAGLTAEDEAFVLESTEGVLPQLEASTPLEPTEHCPILFGCPAHHRAEELALEMLSTVLSDGFTLNVISTRTLPVEIEAIIEREKPMLVLIAVVPPGGVNQARYLCRRLHRRFPELKIMVGYWGKVRDYDKLLVRFRSAGATTVTTSVLQSRAQIRALLTPQPPTPAVAAGEPGAPATAAVKG